MHFRVTLTRHRGELRLLLDSGSLYVPGRFTDDSPIVLTNLFLIAHVAQPGGSLSLATTDSARFADRRGWHASSASDSVLLAEYLRFGERRPLRAMRFRLPLEQAEESGAWLVFRLSGAVVDRWLPFDPKGGLTVGRSGGSVHVYACSDRDLAGHVDSIRANGLRRSYGAMC